MLLHAARGERYPRALRNALAAGKLIRPLLDAEPEALRAYLRRIGQPWREDETNACEDYARNRIRRSALPALEAAYPDAQGRLRGWPHRRSGMRITLPSGLTSWGSARPEAGQRRVSAEEKLEGLHPALAGRALVGLIERAGAPTQSAQTVSQLLDGLPGRGAMNLSGALGRRSARGMSPSSARSKPSRKCRSTCRGRPKRRLARSSSAEPNRGRRATAYTARP